MLLRWRAASQRLYAQAAQRGTAREAEAFARSVLEVWRYSLYSLWL